MLLLTLSALLQTFRPARCEDCHATSRQLGIFYFALYLIALGTGGIKPCVSSFGADQFDDEDPSEKKKKDSFFNWFYFSINIGALIASSLLVYIQENYSWGLGFGIPCVAMALAIASFFSGTFLYRHQKPGGSPLTRIAQVFVTTARKWKLGAPEGYLLYEVPDNESAIQGSRKIEHTDDFRFLDKAAIEAKGMEESPWRLCTVTQVEEVKNLHANLTLLILPYGSSDWIADNVNRGHMDYFFWLLALLSVLNVAFFVYFARWYKYKHVPPYVNINFGLFASQTYPQVSTL